MVLLSVEHINQMRSLTITNKAIRPQLITRVTATKEGAISVITPLRAGSTHITFIHI